MGNAPTGLVTALPWSRLRGRTAGTAAASRSGDGVEMFDAGEGVECCGLGLKLKAPSSPSPVVGASSATSAMLGIGGRTGASCDTGDDEV